MKPCTILVMASGNGSNFQALIDARLPDARITRLVTNRSKALATARADAAGIPWEYFNLISHGFLAKGERDEARVAAARGEYDAALAERVLALEDGVRPELIVLAGWMYVFSGRFLEPMRRAGIRVINLHPALPGAYDGAGAIERAFEDFKAGRATKTGIMVHYVIETVDRGEPIMVREIEWQGEELPQLEERIHSYEHELIVGAAAKVVAEIVASRE
ncbi:Phosphoribosylglycinamide formyltransferase [Escovopsis weberi]|uniref:phosphoribosylglycinamide formyltransferase 1 n=1 Tax=Escovopsis weberi TaxID=150374 RepID=A0A0M8MQK9_ESCWE|nr:Phosphoribosylglycinamide formyltransferase [Escovopsis weberi]